MDNRAVIYSVFVAPKSVSIATETRATCTVCSADFAHFRVAAVTCFSFVPPLERGLLMHGLAKPPAFKGERPTFSPDPPATQLDFKGVLALARALAMDLHGRAVDLWGVPKGSDRSRMLKEIRPGLSGRAAANAAVRKKSKAMAKAGRAAGRRPPG